MSDKLKAIFEQNTVTGEDALNAKDGSIPRRRLTFTLDHRVCSGVFTEDIRLTLRSLMVGEELQVGRALDSNDGMALLHGMAMKSLEKFDGEDIVRVEHREWLWDALGSGGRNIVLGKMAALAGPIEDALKKADETLKVE